MEHHLLVLASTLDSQCKYSILYDRGVNLGYYSQFNRWRVCCTGTVYSFNFLNMTRKVILYVLLKGYWQNPLVSLGTCGCMTTTVFMSCLGTRLGHGGFACWGWTLDITGFTEWHMVCKLAHCILLINGDCINS